MVGEILGLGIVACIALIVIVVIAFLVVWLFFKILIEFFPSVVVALIVFLISRDFLLTLVAFLLSAILFAAIGVSRRRRRREYRGYSRGPR
jgi:hypothetical protein